MNKLLVFASVLLLSACARQNFLAVPERGGHDWNIGGQGSQNVGATSTTYRMAPGPGEDLIELQPGETLWMIAERYNQGLYDLIKRNDFTPNPLPGRGTTVIVPAVPQTR